MTPAARVQAAIEVLDVILDGTPAEKALTGWARGARYAGSKDRAAVRDHVFHVLRRQRSCAAHGGGLHGRSLMIGALRAEGTPPEMLFTGEGYAPTPLGEPDAMGGRPDARDLWDLPDWLIDAFGQSLGSGAEAAAQALRNRAPVMLRANLRKISRDEARVVLAEDAIVAVPHPIAQTALRVEDGARRLSGSRAYQEGLVELQDGSSQAAMEIVPVPEGGKVLDYCAGGGGKTLALAARMQAWWFVHDAAPQRMKDLPDRAARAGVSVEGLLPGQVAGQAPFDLVLCDVPCSGSGTWRRAPEAKWQLTSDRLSELVAIQAEILCEAARMVAPGGVLAYATCSVLRAENQDQIARFLSENPLWQGCQQRVWPVSDGGDGFFTAILSCAAEGIAQS